jgi:hypothetical protein
MPRSDAGMVHREDRSAHLGPCMVRLQLAIGNLVPAGLFISQNAEYGPLGTTAVGGMAHLVCGGYCGRERNTLAGGAFRRVHHQGVLSRDIGTRAIEPALGRRSNSKIRGSQLGLAASAARTATPFVGGATIVAGRTIHSRHVFQPSGTVWDYRGWHRHSLAVRGGLCSVYYDRRNRIEGAGYYFLPYLRVRASASTGVGEGAHYDFHAPGCRPILREFGSGRCIAKAKLENFGGRYASHVDHRLLQSKTTMGLRTIAVSGHPSYSVGGSSLRCLHPKASADFRVHYVRSENVAVGMGRRLRGNGLPSFVLSGIHACAAVGSFRLVSLFCCSVDSVGAAPFHRYAAPAQPITLVPG